MAEQRSNDNAQAVKVLHFADLHLGVENYGRIDGKTGLHQRVVDFLRSFDYLVNYAQDSEVDVVVFAGDAFRNQKPNPTVQREFARMIRRLVKAGIKVVLLIGNHDLPNMDKQANSMAVYNALEIDGVYVANTAEVRVIDTKHGPVQIATLPHFSRSQLVARLKDAHPEYRKKTLAQLDQLMLETVDTLIDQLAQRIDTTIPALLTAHVSLTSASVGAENRSILAGNEMAVMPSALQRPEFDYVALGHIHKFQDLSKNAYPHLVYSGSIERVDFGEEHEAKGFCLINMVRGQTTYEFVPTPARRFVTIDIDCAGDDPTAEVLKKIAVANIDDAVVRVVVRVPSQFADHIRRDEIRAALNSAHHVAYITVEKTGDSVRTRNPNLTEAQSPLGALDEFIKTRDDLAGRKKELLEYGQKLIAELERGLK